jgi:DNA uptake protein ComE-like DNA-binding protein
VLVRFFLRPLPKSQWLAVSLAATVVFLAVLGCWWKRRQAPPFPAFLPIVVEVRGDVRHPGVLMLDAPVTVMQVVAASACRCEPSPNDQTPVLQKTVVTGQRLQVTCSGQDSPRIDIGFMAAAARLTLGLKLDLNRVPRTDLILLPGMKPQWAQAIVERRDRQRWRELAELQEIRGIGPRTVEKWVDFLEVHEADPSP